MHPCFLGDRLAGGLRRDAWQLLLRFSPKLGCMPMAFSKLRPTGTHGALVGESPWLHFLVDFAAVGFAPENGQWLLGSIKRTTSSRTINLAAFSFISCLVTLSGMPKQLRYDKSAGQWVDEDGKSIHGESSSAVWFRIDECDTSSHTVTLKGVMQWPPANRLRAQASAASASSSGGDLVADVPNGHDEAPKNGAPRDGVPKAGVRKAGVPKEGAPMDGAPKSKKRRRGSDVATPSVE